MLELLSADKDYVEVNSCPKVCAPSIASHCTAVHFFLPFICFYSGWLTIVYNQRKTTANCVLQNLLIFIHSKLLAKLLLEKEIKSSLGQTLVRKDELTKTKEFFLFLYRKGSKCPLI